MTVETLRLLGKIEPALRERLGDGRMRVAS